LDNHSAGVGDVITKIGAALSDISGEDAVGGYISDFCTNNMQAVQTFLKEQQDDDSNSASTTTDPNAKPSPPVGTASPAQTNPTCNYNSVDQFSIGDVQDAHNFLAQEGYGNNNDNCCTGDKGACGQLAVSGGVTIQMCGPPSSGVQCAACANIAIALNVLNVDCQKDYKMGGTEGIPYLDGVTLELAAPVVT